MKTDKQSYAAYQVNASGLRVRKDVSGVGAHQELVAYNGGRQRVGSYRPNGSGGFDVEEGLVYLPGSWRLLATVRGQAVSGVNGTAYPVLSDQIGTPRAVLDPTTGDRRWTWVSKEAFGDDAPNGNPDSLPGGSFTFDARFPGQFLDAETGLFHNGYRDYNPRLGRYVQSDPIGLEAGWNTYGYVGGNPMWKFDTLGLSDEDVASILEWHKNSVSEMTQNNLRLDIGWLNNASKVGIDVFGDGKPGGNYLVCSGQASYEKRFMDQRANGLDDSWVFYTDSVPGHHWLVAISANKEDPTIWLDPWSNQVSVGRRCATCGSIYADYLSLKNGRGLRNQPTLTAAVIESIKNSLKKKESSK